jgi:NTP pyrophosphatase (non-canonical NTP hydrolase)
MDCQKILAEFTAIATRQQWQTKHNPKNLAAAISVEAAELLAEVQWLSDAQSGQLASDPAKVEAIGAEAADIVMYVLALCDRLGIDLESAIEAKQAVNRARLGVESENEVENESGK